MSIIDKIKNQLSNTHETVTPESIDRALKARRLNQMNDTQGNQTVDEIESVVIGGGNATITDDKPYCGEFESKDYADKVDKKYKYEKVSFDKASQAIAAWEDGELYTNVSSETFSKIETATEVLTYLYRLYRRIELTPEEIQAQEMECIIEILMDRVHFNNSDLPKTIARILVDNGFKKSKG
ncbi:hypothetical protein NVP1029O_19 [Vibrio phage 1.029.O._10N.261.55.A7]|nr:hypothetical protein NVP1029O_19 [Vibrio phage 1.029.O._10N.261.55.A7]